MKVLICDDQDVVCEGLKAILDTEPSLEVVGTAHDGAEALELIPRLHPDLVLMDLKMPVMNGVQATRRISQAHPEVKVLVLTTYDADEWVFDAIRGGAAGYLLKDIPREELVAAIKGTLRGQAHVDPGVTSKLLAHIAHGSPAPQASLQADLSEREREVLGLLGHGFSNADIAARLCLSEGTVRNHVSAVLDKLGVADRTQAAVLAIRHGLTNLEE